MLTWLDSFSTVCAHPARATITAMPLGEIARSNPPNSSAATPIKDTAAVQVHQHALQHSFRGGFVRVNDHSAIS